MRFPDSFQRLHGKKPAEKASALSRAAKRRRSLFALALKKRRFRSAFRRETKKAASPGRLFEISLP
jgi:hypothetical protein